AAPEAGSRDAPSLAASPPDQGLRMTVEIADQIAHRARRAGELANCILQTVLARRTADYLIGRPRGAFGGLGRAVDLVGRPAQLREQLRDLRASPGHDLMKLLEAGVELRDRVLQLRRRDERVDMLGGVADILPDLLDGKLVDARDDRVDPVIRSGRNLRH